jgi:hypothetical protein
VEPKLRNHPAQTQLEIEAVLPERDAEKPASE